MEDSYRHKGFRKKLIEELKQKGIKQSAVLRAMENVPRHYFFDSAFVEHAYQDKAFPIGEGQTISQPYTVAFQTELLEVTPGMKILEIGTGSGYQAAILAEIGAKLTSLEFIPALYKRAQIMLAKMNYKVQLICGDGSEGYLPMAPYQGIIVTAGAPTVPSALIHQLEIGGRLVIPVGDREKQKMLLIIKESSQKIIKKEFANFSFVPLVGSQGWG